MSRTIEIGRAVLSSPSTKLELWLTTLIAISPQQNSTDIEQYDSSLLLDLLSSGNVWVGRGNGLHIDLHLRLRGEPLTDRHLQELGNSIVEAPVWGQLKLQPSISIGSMPLNGTLVVNISHADDDGSSETKTPHRILQNVPATDLRPPEKVSKFNLDIVRFSMEIVETKKRPRPKKPKRSKTTPSESATTFSQHKPLGKGSNEERADIPYESNAMPSLPQDEDSILACQVVTFRGSQKRKRTPTRINVKPDSLALQDSTQNVANHTQRSAHSDLRNSASDLEDMKFMIDGALRLSASGTLNSRSANGVKVKASTFAQGLMEVIPSLWSPGYLLALSQRAHLIPVISRSFSQIGCLRATSTSLKQKVKGFVVDQTVDKNSNTTEVEPSLRQLSSSLSSRLWLHMQKNFMCRPMAGLQAFVASKQHDMVSVDRGFSGQQGRVGDEPLSTDFKHKDGGFSNRQLLRKVNRTTHVGGDNFSTKNVVPSTAEHDWRDIEIVDDLLFDIDPGLRAGSTLAEMTNRFHVV